MRNFYSKSIKALAFAMCFTFGVASLNAQAININWKGGVSTNALIPENWDPVSGVDGNNIIVGHVGTYATPATPNHPIVARDSELLFRSLGVAGPYYFEEPILDGEGNPVLDGEGNPTFTPISWPGAEITFSMAAGIEARQAPDNVSTYQGGKITVNSGVFNHTRSNYYMENPNSVFVIEGDGRAVFNTFLFGQNNGPNGGKMFVRGNGVWHINSGLARWATNWENSVLTITENGQTWLPGDQRGEVAYRLNETGQITGGDDYYIHYYYNLAGSRTYVMAKPEGTAFIYFADRLVERIERLVAGVPGSLIAVENSAAFEGALNYTWKYGTQSGGPYETVLFSGADANELAPNFPSGGNFFLVCEVTTAASVTVVSNEFEYLVGSGKVVPSPQGKQFLRGNQTGGLITATVDGTLTSAEWKWSTTSGEGYQSFTPAVTGVSFAPKFDEIGVYYIVLDAMVDGNLERSTEIEIQLQAWNAAALPITWTGKVDNDFANMFNWTPHAYPNRNNVIVPVTTAPNWPVFTAGRDTIWNGSNIAYQAPVMDGETVVTPAIKAKLIVRGNSQDDVLLWNNDAYGLHGVLQIESGKFEKIGNLLRFEHTSGELRVSGTGVAQFFPWNADHSYLCMGNSNSPGRGGSIYLSGNGKIIVEPAALFRLTTNPDATFSKIHFAENGQFVFAGNFVNGATVYNTNNRFVIPEGFALKNVYDPNTNFTYVGVRDLNAFAIADVATQYLSVGQNSEVFTLSNVGSLDNIVWKYSNSPVGPWTAFSPAITGNQASVSFATPDTYFVAAEAGDGTVTSNAVKVVVVDFKVQVAEEGGVYTLSVVLPAGMTASGWMVKGAADAEYVVSDFGGVELEYMLDAFQFEADGVYSLTFAGILKGDNEQDVVIYATPASVTISEGGIASVQGGATSILNRELISVGVYPNPSTGSFFINVAAEKYTVEVIDLSGAVISSKSVVGQGESISISSKGVYMLKVTTAEGMGVTRVVVK